MFYTLTKTQELVFEGQLQAHYFVEMFEDEEKTIPIGQQTLVVSGDALNNPEQAFLNGINSSTENRIQTYDQKRAQEYPSFADQFDLLYHGGYDAWKDAIKAVKDKYPKVGA